MSDESNDRKPVYVREIPYAKAKEMFKVELPRNLLIGLESCINQCSDIDQGLNLIRSAIMMPPEAGTYYIPAIEDHAFLAKMSSMSGTEILGVMMTVRLAMHHTICNIASYKALKETLDGMMSKGLDPKEIKERMDKLPDVNIPEDPWDNPDTRH